MNDLFAAFQQAFSAQDPHYEWVLEINLDGSGLFLGKDIALKKDAVLEFSTFEEGVRIAQGRMSMQPWIREYLEVGSPCFSCKKVYSENEMEYVNQGVYTEYEYKAVCSLCKAKNWQALDEDMEQERYAESHGLFSDRAWTYRQEERYAGELEGAWDD